MNSEFEKLQEENSKLQELANTDELTGILNRRAAERQISEELAKGGALFVCDLDYFKHINDKYGHLKGDEYLKNAAQIFKSSLREGDILGRIGGDEFVIFAPGKQTEKTLYIIAEKIAKRFDAYNLMNTIMLRASIGKTICVPGDTYETMFSRADRDLLIEKKKKHLHDNEKQHTYADGWIHDVNQIRAELEEEFSSESGAFCRDFECFKNVFRFTARNLKRSGRPASVVLISIAESADTLPQEKMLACMENLDKILKTHIRAGDLYARYSSCQFLLFLCNAAEADANMVSERIKAYFEETLTDDTKAAIFHHTCFQMEG